MKNKYRVGNFVNASYRINGKTGEWKTDVTHHSK